MSETKKQKAATAYGEVEFETVDCVNCGNDVMADDAIYVGVGLHESSTGGINSTSYDTYHEALPLCEYCSEGTLGYTPGWRNELNRPKHLIGYITVAVSALAGALVGYGLALSVFWTALAVGIVVFSFGFAWVLTEMVE